MRFPLHAKIMLISPPFASSIRLPPLARCCCSISVAQSKGFSLSIANKISKWRQSCNFIARASRGQRAKQTPEMDATYDNEFDIEEEEELNGPRKRFSGRRVGLEEEDEERDYDRDPEFADILGSCLDDPEKARSKINERFSKKKHKILHPKTGSANAMKVTFNKFDFSNSYIWFEFYNVPMEKDITLICDTIRSWHIIGRLGGCNSMNMQLSQAPLDSKRPSYDAIQGANIEPTTFYNIGDFEIQENIARIWVDIGTSEPLLLDVLINALTHISSDYVGLKQVTFGGSEFEGWNENLTSEETGYSVRKI